MRALFFALLLAPSLTLAVGRPSEMLPDPAQESRAQQIGRELRCMVCQNQSIEDSEADLARDLRRLVRERVAAGESDVAVREHIHARYGDFVLLRPPFNWVTAPLWALPVLVLTGGALALVMMRRRAARRSGPAPLTPAERARLAKLEDES
ncbi:cytochrome c-type biogenesis protein [Roseomonas xinghualingensis]|uniref:cytochrome c-type biogenesis protein n=1 Tax=Roseomonas xinghualingensis TaxID=2986475 RepID=UPI0021F0C5B3|nr:cytochrome c-type biogenesis protein [Roseomonas sp. SXEYE001]MCV4207062.1 cytochrome c-type biogenesis protein CcmH [Roseomonas sp. SXEYE001]